jgi:DNA polymerase elongation subunit (family B)
MPALQLRICRAGLAKGLPPGIEVELNEQFKAMFSYKAKNYALLTREGEVVINGDGLKSRGPSCCFTA